MPTRGKDAAGTKNSKRRTQVKELPRPEKELSGDEQKKIKGGEIVSDGDSDARGVGYR